MTLVVVFDLPLWELVGYVSMACSFVASAWLLYACWRVPRQLFTRQLWHLACADLGFSVVDPLIEFIQKRLWPSSPPKSFTGCSRSAVHFFLLSICLMELEIAAGIAASSLRSVRVSAALAKILVWNWLVALLCSALDYATQTDDVLDGNVNGPSPVVAVVISITFVSSILLYVVAIIAVLRTWSPRAVIWRASTRALVYPPAFFLTMLPAWLVYMNIVPSSSETGILDWCYSCVYSNGFVNAAVYSLQKRQLCSRKRTHAMSDEADLSWQRAATPSFHVGFGSESCVSAAIAATVTTATEESEAEDALWAPFILVEDSTSTRSGTGVGSSAFATSSRASLSEPPCSSDA